MTQQFASFVAQASQFNCLEMTGPAVTPARGIAIYFNDPTQGPKCALACPAGTVYRNYLCQEGVGQGESQIDCLVDVAAVVNNTKHKYWKMMNGYGAVPACGKALLLPCPPAAAPPAAVALL